MDVTFAFHVKAIIDVGFNNNVVVAGDGVVHSSKQRQDPPYRSLRTADSSVLFCRVPLFCLSLSVPLV